MVQQGHANDLTFANVENIPRELPDDDGKFLH